MQKTKTYKFDQSLWYTHLSGRHLTAKDGKRFYARFAKGEDTINEREQSEFAKPSRIYVDGEFKVSTDKLEQEFIESRPDFGRRIIEFNPAKVHEDNIKSLTELAEVMSIVVALDETSARSAGYRIFGKSALTKDINEVKGLLVAKVNEDPASVRKIVEDKKDADYAIIGLAMVKEIIYEAKGGNEIRFVDTDELITTVRSTDKPIDALASLFSTLEGKEIKRAIFAKLTSGTADASTPDVEVDEEILEELGTKPKATGRGRSASK